MASESRHLFLNNLHESVTEDTLREDLIRQFPRFFLEAHNQGNLQVKVFLPRKKLVRGKEVNSIQVVATVTGNLINVKDLQKEATGKKLAGFQYNFKFDKGDDRDEYGRFCHNMGGEDRRRLRDLQSEAHRKCNIKLLPDLEAGLDGTFHNNCFATCAHSGVTKKVLGATHFMKDGRKWRLQYQSVLDCLQSIVKHNNQVLPNWRGVNERFVFTNLATDTECNVSIGQGLGHGGQMLDFNAIQSRYGYIPFTMFNRDIVDVEGMWSITSPCLKCNGVFSAIGIDQNIGFVASHCATCKYDETKTFSDKGRAYSWPNEDFTRLIELRRNFDEETKWGVLFRPMKTRYEDATDYRDIAGPLTFWEWREAQLNFDSHAATGTLIKTKIESDELHTIDVCVPNSGFWNSKTMPVIERLNVALLVHEKGIAKLVTKDASFFWISNKRDEGLCVVTATLQLKVGSLIELDQAVVLTPKPRGSLYYAIKDFLDRWIIGQVSTRWLYFILDPSASNPSYDLEIPEILVDYYREGYYRMHDDLDNDQVSGLQNALHFSCSVIHGPPGTGKTYVCSVILISLHILFPTSRTIAVSQNDFACDKLCEDLNTTLDVFFYNDPPFYVLRVFSKTQELVMRSNNSSREFGRNVKILHELVDLFIREEEDHYIQGILKRIQDGQYPELSYTEKKDWKAAVAKIEKQVFQKTSYSVVVCTPETFLDTRFRKEDNGFPIMTVDNILIDEAGYINQTVSLPLLDYNQRRVIYAGDDKQLRSVVLNQSVELSGYDMSTIEWLRKADCKLPWITLQTQYRMTKVLCKFVSELTYADTPLVCGPNTPNDIPENIKREFGVNSPLLVYDHDGPETKHDREITNMREVVIIKDVCKRLLRAGVKCDEISVMSLYSSQCNLINNSIRHLGIQAKTCDSMQGRENNVCIVSFVRSGDNGIGFSRSANRVNVMLSRAKQFLVLVLNRRTFQETNVQVVTKMLRLIEKYGEIQRVY